jgi:hypothetical protein
VKQNVGLGSGRRGDLVSASPRTGLALMLTVGDEEGEEKFAKA